MHIEVWVVEIKREWKLGTSLYSLYECVADTDICCKVFSLNRGKEIMNFSQDWPTRHNKICREMIFHPKHFCGAAFSNTLPNIHASLHGYISHSAEMPHICGFKSVEEIFALQCLAFFWTRYGPFLSNKNCCSRSSLFRAITESFKLKWLINLIEDLSFYSIKWSMSVQESVWG